MQVILSYSILGVIALETLVVFNVANYDKVADFLKGQKHARRKRAAIARQLREASQLHGAAPPLFLGLSRAGGNHKRSTTHVPAHHGFCQ